MRSRLASAASSVPAHTFHSSKILLSSALRQVGLWKRGRNYDTSDAIPYTSQKRTQL